MGGESVHLPRDFEYEFVQAVYALGFDELEGAEKGFGVEQIELEGLSGLGRDWTQVRELLGCGWAEGGLEDGVEQEKAVVCQATAYRTIGGDYTFVLDVVDPYKVVVLSMRKAKGVNLDSKWLRL